MKTRDSFVANSSSTSFILGDLRKDASKSLKTKINMEVNLSDYLEESIYSLEELKDYEEYHSLPIEEYEKAKEIIKNGGVVRVISVSNEDTDEISNFLYYHGLNDLEHMPNVEIIRGDY